MVRLGRFVDEDKSGFRVYPYAVEKLAGKAGVLDKPTGVDFVAIFAVVDGVAFTFGNFCLFFGEVDVFEERARAGFD